MYESIPVTYNVFESGHDPMDLNLATQVRLIDEGDGNLYIILEQGNSSSVSFELLELKEVTWVAEKMMEEYKKQKGNVL